MGRRVYKETNYKRTNWLWNGNVPLHEWESLSTGSILHLVTWVFEEGTFVPCAKITEDQSYSIVTDYLGTPTQMFDEDGKNVWDAELDVYGKVRTFKGSSLSDCPFRYQGQYEDAETGLYYNRFRYYDPTIGNYISQDPIKLNGGGRLYGYVRNCNIWIDPYGLEREPIMFLSDGGGVIHPETIGASTPHGVFTIDATGSYFDDRKALAEAAGINDPGKDWRSHHIGYDPETNTMQMQFVHKDYHSYPHIGGANEFKQNTGFEYGSDEAIAEANKRNKAKIKSGCKA